MFDWFKRLVALREGQSGEVRRPARHDDPVATSAFEKRQEGDDPSRRRRSDGVAKEEPPDDGD